MTVLLDLPAPSDQATPLNTSEFHAWVVLEVSVVALGPRCHPSGLSLSSAVLTARDHRREHRGDVGLFASLDPERITVTDG